jgi:light-harvesting complex I chlorophyll a/b binding protein 5
MQAALCNTRVFTARTQSRSASRRSVRVQAADRTLWLPGIQAPKHLDGKLAGDYGFDPLGLGVDSDRLKWYAEAEKTNGRWAMAAVAGILFTEILGKAKWFEAGAQEYWMDNGPLLAVEAVIMGFLELKRFQGWKETGTSGFLNAFPFDPAGMNSPSMATKEVKNGRLAMTAFVGFAVQALLTRQGPIEALQSHLSSPFTNNFVGSINNLPNVIGQ